MKTKTIYAAIDELSHLADNLELCAFDLNTGMLDTFIKRLRELSCILPEPQPVYKEGTPLIEIAADGWSRGFLIEQTISELIAQGLPFEVVIRSLVEGLWTEWNENLDSMNKAEQKPVATEILHEALTCMDRARNILTDGKPTPTNNWGMLDTRYLRERLAKNSPTESRPQGDVSIDENLLDAARDFYNRTIADPVVIIRAFTQERQQSIAEAGERLRLALVARLGESKNG
jgi:hypothetical protein